MHAIQPGTLKKENTIAFDNGGFDQRQTNKNIISKEEEPSTKTHSLNYLLYVSGPWKTD